jgi:hypothetical protein
MIAAKPDRRLTRPEPSAAPTAALRSPDDRLDHDVRRKRLLQAGHATQLRGLLSNELIFQRRHEYHRKAEACRRELASELDPGAVAELNVHDKATRLARRRGAQKGVGGIKGTDGVSERRQYGPQGSSHSRIVIDDGYDFFGIDVKPGCHRL